MSERLATLAGGRRVVLNPVLRRELIERWRGRRAFVVLTVYLGVLIGIMLLLLWAGREILGDQFRFGEFVDPGPVLGRFLLENLVAVVLLLVLFIGPGYAAAQVSGERERKTLHLLQVTLVKPWSIVLGKLGAAVAWLVLLVVASLPLGAVAFFLGGVTIADLGRAVVYVVGIALAIAAIGIGVSSLTRKTTASIVITYGLVLMLVVGSLFATGVEAVLREDEFRGGRTPRLVSLTFNPFYGLADAVRSSTQNVMLPTVLTPFAAGLPRENDGFLGGPDPRFGPIDVAVPEDGPLILDQQILDDDLDAFDDPTRRRPVWLQVLSLHLALGIVAMVLASRRVQPGRGPRRRRESAERVVVAADTSPGYAPLPPPPPEARIGGGEATPPPPPASDPSKEGS